jgi:hypothetical protein
MAILYCALALAVSGFVPAAGDEPGSGTGEPEPAGQAGPADQANPAPAGDEAAEGKLALGDPLSFVRDVMPRISRLGCNAVACHGSQKGKGGLSLSMFGAAPQADYEALTKADGGRRVNRVEPLKSLFLLKATGSVAHEGKEKIPVGSADYRLFAAWVAQGLPFSRDKEPTLVSVEAPPGDRILQKGETLTLAASAAKRSSS